ncbi:MAG: RNA polymerase sigma factor [Anaerolineae bacterium]
MSRRTDQEWLSDLRARGKAQQRAFADLGRYLFTVVYNYLCQRQAGVVRLQQLDSAELEELARGFAQDALQAVWEKLSTYEGRGKLTSWAATIAIRTAAYEIRKPYWRERRMSLPPAYNPDTNPEEWGGPNREWQATTDLSPDARLQTAEILDLIETTLQQDLSERQRLAFVAQFIEDRTSDEIAEELNVSRNAVYMLIFEARKKIKRRLIEAGHTPEDVLRVFQEQSTCPGGTP